MDGARRTLPLGEDGQWILGVAFALVLFSVAIAAGVLWARVQSRPAAPKASSTAQVVARP